jgi:hypothetical protein
VEIHPGGAAHCWPPELFSQIRPVLAAGALELEAVPFKQLVLAKLREKINLSKETTYCPVGP